METTAMAPMLRSQRLGIESLLSDLTLANTFLDLAQATRNRQLARRNVHLARRAYQTTQRLYGELAPTETEAQAFRAASERLAARLRQWEG